MLKVITKGSYLSKKVLVVLLLLLLLIIPQINISGYVQPTIISKFIYFIYSCFALIGFYSIGVLFKKHSFISFTKLDLSLFVLLAYMILNRYGIQSLFGFSIRYMELLGLSSLYIVLRSLSATYYIWILLAIIVSGICQAVYGNLQLLGYYPSNHYGFKMTGSFFNPGPYAGFLVAVWPITLGFYLFKEALIIQAQRNHKSFFIRTSIKYTLEYIPLLGIVCILLVIPASQSRASWLAVLGSSLLLLEFKYAMLKNGFKKLNVLKRGILIVLSVIVLAVGSFGVYHFKKGSSHGRLFIWKVTTEIIADTPIFGVGFDRFKTYYMNYQANYFDKYGETSEALVADNTYYAFNEWLQFFSEQGLVGVLMLAMVIIVLFKTRVNHKDKPVYAILTVSILAIGIFACFSYPMQILPVKMVLLVALGLLSSLGRDKAYPLKLPHRFGINHLFKGVFLVLISIGIFKGTVYIHTLSEGYKTWKLALTPYWNYEDVLIAYKNAYPLFKNEGDFLMNYGKTLSLAKKDEKAIAILKQAKQHLNTTIIQTALGDAYKGVKAYHNADKAYKRAANMIPSRFYPMYLQAKLYEESGAITKAIAMAKVILEKEVKIPSTAIKEIQTEMEGIIAKYDIKLLGLNKS